MSSQMETRSKKGLWTGRIISGIIVLFLLFDSVTKIALADFVVKASAQFGYPDSLLQAVGFILLFCLVLYSIPKTAIIGAMLLTGYLGGAVDANLRIGAPLFSNALFPVYFGIIAWAGLYLRNQRVRELFALTKGE